MPRAVKLSERFYQKFGHDLVGELVEMLNDMDTTYRDDLRELNELNFARFDAKLEQRLAELKAEFRVAHEALGRTLIKWMFGFWITTVTTLGGLVVAVLHFLPAARL